MVSYNHVEGITQGTLNQFMDTFYYEQLIALRDAFYNKETRSELLNKLETTIKQAKDEYGFKKI